MELGDEDFAQEGTQPPEQDVDAVADRGEHGVDGFAGAVSKVIASHAVPGLEVSDHELDRSKSHAASGKTPRCARQASPKRSR
jgi:hypothetical protein